ncbi:MAG TPA: PIN domain-containing protein [Candidatus Limnocylindria bacterium]|nr:PIN domain-containing protein [Candidatus Limnocylindria bacterium]
MAVIVDTSVLYALTDRAEAQHQACVAAIGGEEEAIIVPQPVLPEICYLVASRLGAGSEARFLTGLIASDWRLEPMSEADLKRATALVQEYEDADFGFVDAAVTAIAERLAVTRIYTLDRRDFQMVRPNHAKAFEVLP